MSEKILIIGKSGQLARALAAIYGQSAVALGRDELDLLDPDLRPHIKQLIEQHRPRAVINAAAYTQVDKAEDESEVEAYLANSKAVKDIASACKKIDVPFVHVSTDYVFDGSGDTPWKETDEPNPINAYGESKLEGEKVIDPAAPTLIVRTSWIYDAQGKNFYNTMLRLFKEKDELKVVSDQIGSPTYAPHLAQGIAAILKAALTKPEFPSGVYHLCAGGHTSWHGFAEAILGLARKRDSRIRCGRVHPIPSAQYPTPASRPLNSRLDCSKAEKTFGVALPHWQEGLKACMEETYGRT